MEQKTVPATRARLPDLSGVDFAQPDEVKAYLTSLKMAIELSLQQRPAQTTALSQQIFRSENGTSYKMTVDDAGVPVFTPVGPTTQVQL